MGYKYASSLDFPLHKGNNLSAKEKKDLENSGLFDTGWSNSFGQPLLLEKSTNTIYSLCRVKISSTCSTVPPSRRDFEEDLDSLITTINTGTAM